ncbi:MAG: glycoside hydrolase family 3 N-terminal domain-containing protein [Breznakibacter sp.]
MIGKLNQNIILVSLALLSLISCKNGGQGEAPIYLDRSQPVEMRVENLLQQMTLEEKVAQMCQYVGPQHIREAEIQVSADELKKSDSHAFYPGLTIEGIEAMTEKGLIGSFLHVVDVNEANHLQSLAQKSRLKIPLLIGIDAIHGTGLVEGATVYPTPIGLASSWNPEMVYQLALETSKEVRAAGAQWAFTPNIDVARDARWGRVGETFGEDPLLVSQMGVAMIKGLQAIDEKGNMHVIACAKHLIAGSQSVNGLNGAPTDLSERTIREIFLPPYQAAIEAGVHSLMTAHNELNGVPCHADHWMMEEVVRKELGFDGFFVSDWMDIERLATIHRVAENQKEACYQTVEAGMDMHMHGPNFLEPVVELVKEGRLSEERINASVRRLLKVKFQLGLFENPYVDTLDTKNVLFNAQHKATALKAAEESLVLLKNEQDLLPLAKGKYKRILVTGPNADNLAILGDWSAPQPDENVTTVLEGLKQMDPACQFDFVDVGLNPRFMTHSQVDEAAKRAKQSDLAIVVVGENSFRWEWKDKTCGENSDRSELTLPGLQQLLVEKIHATGKPVIVVLVNGRPLATEWIAEHIPAIVEAWEPGSFGGEAVAKLIYGDINPSGKLPITIPRSVGHQLSIYNHKPSHFFHKYVTTDSDPLFFFGHGLSYTTFSYQNVKLSKPSMTSRDSLVLQVEVANTGSRDGDEIVQLYINDKLSSVTRPVKELKAFRKVFIPAGETKQLSFVIKPEMLQFLDKHMKLVVEPGDFEVLVGGSSADDALIKVPFRLE